MSNVIAQTDGVRRGRPGFRFSVMDAAAIVVVVIAAVGLYSSIGELAFLFPVVLFHFFLFCNVFRVRRESELIWAGVFIVNFAVWSLADAFTWSHVLLSQTPVTLAILVIELRSPRYHGIGYSYVNPRGQLNPLEVQP